MIKYDKKMKSAIEYRKKIDTALAKICYERIKQITHSPVMDKTRKLNHEKSIYYCI